MKNRQDCRHLLLDIINPLKGLYSEGRARLRLDGGGAAYDRDTIELEAFARLLGGLVPFWAGGGRDTLRGIWDKAGTHRDLDRIRGAEECPYINTEDRCYLRWYLLPVLTGQGRQSIKMLKQSVPDMPVCQESVSLRAYQKNGDGVFTSPVSFR